MKDITLKKLNALSKESGGIQINISKLGVKVSTRDTPGVNAKSDNLDDAVLDCWEKLMSYIDWFAANDSFYKEKMNAKKDRLIRNSS